MIVAQTNGNLWRNTHDHCGPIFKEAPISVSTTEGLQFNSLTDIRSVDKTPIADTVTPVTVTEVTGQKFDQDKIRLDLIPREMLEGLGRPLTYGVQKYASNNWRGGIEYSRVSGAALRHLSAWMSGEDIDADSGQKHIEQAFVNLGFLVTFVNEGRNELDDRFKKP